MVDYLYRGFVFVSLNVNFSNKHTSLPQTSDEAKVPSSMRQKQLKRTTAEKRTIFGVVFEPILGSMSKSSRSHCHYPGNATHKVHRR